MSTANKPAPLQTPASLPITRRRFLRGLAWAGAAAILPWERLWAQQPAEPASRPAMRRVWTFSDSHIGCDPALNGGKQGAAWLELALKDLKEKVGPVDYAVPLGDITDKGEAEQLQQYVQARDASQIRLWYELAGNHDFAAVPAGDWRKYVKRPQKYAVIDGNAVWLLVSVEQGKASGRLTRQVANWLEAATAEHKDKNIIVCTHQPVYDTVAGSTGKESYLEQRVFVEQVLGRIRVDLWLSGHIHSGRRNSKYVARRGRTTFINVASLGRMYGTGACTSYVLEMKRGSKELLARCRNHEAGSWLDDQQVKLELPQAWEFDAAPTISPARIPEPTSGPVKVQG
jgi:3',5'-cyclic AMP phosphodiesterase CpdA